MEGQHHVSHIAAFIGARLQHPRPSMNGKNSRVSTIKVDQYKDKFNYVRIYCTLADDEEVKSCWQEQNGDENLALTKEMFKARCLRNDARHYRRCYMDMVEIIPHLRARICAQADYAELLYGTYDEVCARIDEIESLSKVASSPTKIDSVRRRYGCATNDELKSFMSDIYLSYDFNHGV